MVTSHDAIVIGAGQAGPSLAVRFAQAGLKTALIERRGLGGTCVNDGCTPTKALVASARAAHMARRAADFGVFAGQVRVDMAAVRARKDAIVQASVESLERWIGGTRDLTLIRGSGRFTGPDEVTVGTEILRAGKIVINTGGRPTIPDWPGLNGTSYLTSTSILDLDVVPEHLIVVGGSYIGLEFAQIYRRFGAQVTVLEAADRLIAREDLEVSAALRELLVGEGVAVHTGLKGLSTAKTAHGVRVTADFGGRVRLLAGSHLLVAVGRRPNTEDLNLPAARVARDARGFIEVDDRLRTSAPGIWALGDVNGRGAFTSTSFNDYEILAANLLDGEDHRVTDRIPAYGLFTDPPLGRVGMTEQEVRASGRPALKAFMPMTRVGRARERGETFGFMQVLADARTKQILGAAFLGTEGDEAVQVLLASMAAGAPYTTLQRLTPIHPTVSELIPTLLNELRPL